MFNYENILKNLLNPKLNKAQLAKLINYQSVAFTKQRDKLKNNYEDKDLVSAYTAFYLPTNALKLEYLFEQMGEEFKSKIEKTHIVDIGTGPGTYAFAMNELLSENQGISGVDENPLMLEQAKLLNEEVFKIEDISFSNKAPHTEDDLTLVFGNAINEMGMPAAFKIIKRLRPKYIICIEPGTSEVFKMMLQLRKKLLLLKYNINFPCMGQGECPLKEKDDWCHQTIKVSLDHELESLSQVAKLDRKTMPATIHVYSMESEAHENEARIIRLKKNIKHSFLWEVCDSSNKTSLLEVPKKLFSKSEIKDLEKISSGIRIKFEASKTLDNGVVRVSSISILN